MLFPSNIFLFCFFPVVLVLYYGLGHVILRNNITVKNILLLIASLVFYAYGEKWYVLLLVGSILFNYVFGLLINRCDEKSAQKGIAAVKHDRIDAQNDVIGQNNRIAGESKIGKKIVLIVAVIGNLGLLFLFKYLDFVLANCNRFFHTSIALTGIELPIGISFFTFQALSYVADVYRGTSKVQKNPIKLGLYISLFPQLIAGPIVRYETVEKQMSERRESVPLFNEGVIRFITGLGKKVLLADTMALFAARILAQVTNGSKISAALAWLGAAAYTLQIYYDFSGYSDMAIGLGKMFGFSFMENFNYPYIAGSVTEFWRRWHISLSSWFRDYVYIPLGGNTSSGRTYLNMLIVWLLTGIWHGAGWTFILWGMMYFVVLAVERLIGIGRTRKLPPVIANLYTMLVVLVGWVIFMSPSLSIALNYLKTMVGVGAAGWTDSTALFYLKDNIVFFVLAVLFVTPVGKKLEKYRRLQQVLLGAVLLLVIVYIIKGTYSPFIYFSF